MNNLFSLIRRLWHHNYRPILLTLAITTLIWVLALTQPHRLTEGVWTLKLAGCNLDYHTPIHAVALACPGVDYIRLWPLPWSSRGRRRLIQIGCRVGMRGDEAPSIEAGLSFSVSWQRENRLGEVSFTLGAYRVGDIGNNG